MKLNKTVWKLKKRTHICRSLYDTKQITIIVWLVHEFERTPIITPDTHTPSTYHTSPLSPLRINFQVMTVIIIAKICKCKNLNKLIYLKINASWYRALLRLFRGATGLKKNKNKENKSIISFFFKGKTTLLNSKVLKIKL